MRSTHKKLRKDGRISGVCISLQFRDLESVILKHSSYTADRAFCIWRGVRDLDAFEFSGSGRCCCLIPFERVALTRGCCFRYLFPFYFVCKEMNTEVYCRDERYIPRRRGVGKGK